MIKNNKLKAWVRYDGTGRVVPGGPIFQANKPKVGNWKEINAYECCNPTPSPSTTTTTTTSGLMSTAWPVYGAYNPYSACQQVGGWSLILYTSSPTLGNGVIFYSDSSLTTPYNSNHTGNIIAYNGMNYFLGDNGGSTILQTSSCDPFTTTTTTTTTINPLSRYVISDNVTNYPSAVEACASWGTSTYTTVYSPVTDINAIPLGTVFYLDQAMTIPYVGTTSSYFVFGRPGVGMNPPTDPHAVVISEVGATWSDVVVCS